MKKKWIVAALLIATSLAATWLLMRSEADAVRAVFDDAAEKFARDGRETLMDGAMRAKALSEMAVPKGFRFGVEGLGGVETADRHELASLAMMVRQQAETLRLKFRDVEVVVAGETAFVRGVADASGSSPSLGLPEPHVRKFAAQLAKRDGAWLFESVAVMAGGQDD